MRLPRKYKKKIINTFGIGTYRGIIEGFLKIVRYYKNTGSLIRYTGKAMSSKTGFYFDGSKHPNLMLKNTYYAESKII